MAWTVNQDHLLHICVEGDSVDDTYSKLMRIKGINTRIIKKDLGNIRYGSYAIPERLQVLATLWNAGLEAAIDAKANYVLILDSDIKVGPHALARLLGRQKDVVAPMLMWEKRPTYFRDTWGYFKGSRDFQSRPPYHKAYDQNNLFEVDGAGVLLIRAEVLNKGARFDNMEVRGFCGQIRKLGFKIYVDPKTHVHHPEI
jgi:GT2 family glycosyltransferase